jgi:hypothetical protein
LTVDHGNQAPTDFYLPRILFSLRRRESSLLDTIYVGIALLEALF